MKIKNADLLKNKINFALKVTAVFATILLPIYLSLGVPICKFIFNNEKAGIYLSAASFVMLPLGISQITSSILNAIGLELKTLKNYIISAIFLIVSIYFLPKYIGTYALIVGYFLMSTISSIFNVIMLKKRKILDNSYLKVIICMVIFSLICGLLGHFVFNLVNNYILGLCVAGLVTSICMMILIYTFNIADFKVVMLEKRFKRA